jgi:hypothetical protein
LERFLFEGYPLSEILVKGSSRTNPRSIQEGSSGITVTASTDL